MANIKMDINKIANSYETVRTLETCISNHNFHTYFYDMEDYIESVNKKHNNCINGYKNKITEINESIDKIKNKINLLSDSLSKTINMNSRMNDLSEEQARIMRKSTADTLQYRENMQQTQNNDGSTVIVPIPKPEIEEDKPLFPEGYNTTPIGLGIAAAGVTGAIGAVVIDAATPKSYKRNKDKVVYEIDDNDENDYKDYKIADEAEEKEIISLKIDPSMTSYQASRNSESMKKFYDDIDSQ